MSALFSYCTTVLQCSSVESGPRDHGHKKGHVPRALHKALINGHLEAAKKEVLRTHTYCAPQRAHCASEAHISQASELVTVTQVLPPRERRENIANQSTNEEHVLLGQAKVHFYDSVVMSSSVQFAFCSSQGHRSFPYTLGEHENDGRDNVICFNVSSCMSYTPSCTKV